MVKGSIEKDSLQRESVADIYSRYHAPLKGFIAKRIPSKEDVEDILQNVFYQLSRLNVEESPIVYISGWLYSVTRNQITDYYRKHRESEMPGVSDFDDDDDAFVNDITNILTDPNSPETEFIKTLVWEELELALTELPAEQRKVFELTELEGFSFNEIAEATGIGVNTLISRKRYAVLHLRKRLFELYDDLLTG